MTRNWAGNLEYAATELLAPSSLPELQELVARGSRVRALGSRHSFSTVADTDGQQVSLAGLPHRVTVDPAERSATVAAGMTYADVAVRLHQAGWALRSLASLPHITVAGACATGTHGSGDANQGLAAAVQAMTVVGPDGELVELAPARDAATFNAARVGLGGMGVTVALTLAVEPTYDVAQQVYDDLPFEEFDEHLDEIMSSATSVSLFTDFAAPRFNQVWRKRRIDDDVSLGWPSHWLGSVLADGPRHPIAGMSAENCTTQGGEPGPWFARLPHFRWDSTPSAGDELQSEYLVAREDAPAAFAELRAIAPDFASVLQISECRSIAADDCWLSPAYGRPTIGFHFTWRPDAAAVRPVLAAIEARLGRFDVRPHWGKLHQFSPERVVAAYPRLPDYQAARSRFDPDGVFSNDLLDSLPAHQHSRRRIANGRSER